MGPEEKLPWRLDLDLELELEWFTFIKHAPAVTHVTADYFKGGFEIDLDAKMGI